MKFFNRVVAALVLVLAGSCASYVDHDVANRMCGHVVGRIEKFPQGATPQELQQAKDLKTRLAEAPLEVDPNLFILSVNEVTATHDRIVLGLDNVDVDTKQVWLSTSELLRAIFRAAMQE